MSGRQLRRSIAYALWLCCAAVLLAAVPHTSARADGTGKLPIVGQVWFSDSRTAGQAERAFREGLRELGYVEGKDVIIVTRYANGDATELPALVNELVALPAQVLLVSSAAVRPTMEATKTIPIVCATMANALESGLVTSLSHPAGNLTGLSGQIGEAHLKLLSMAKEILPRLTSLAVVYDATYPENVPFGPWFVGIQVACPRF